MYPWMGTDVRRNLVTGTSFGADVVLNFCSSKGHNREGVFLVGQRNLRGGVIDANKCIGKGSRYGSSPDSYVGGT